MSLYDDIDVDVPSEGEKSTSGQMLGGINLTFLKDQLKAKKASLQNAQKSLSTSIAASSSTPSASGQSQPTTTVGQAPVVPAFTPSTISRPRFSATPNRPAATPFINLKPRKAMPLPLDTTATFSIVPQALKESKVFLFGEIEIEDEYNPLVPTDYAVYKPKREAQQAKERAAKEVAERIAKGHAEEERKRKAGAAIAPPPMLVEDAAAKAPPTTPTPPPQVYEPPAKFGKASSRGLGVAQAIMSRMGYQEGRGLGRDEQGMSSALRMEKTGGGKGGRIVGEDVRKDAPGVKVQEFVTEPPLKAGPIGPAPNITELLKSASKIVMLKNMVMPNDVDAELESEIKEEMTKYGQLASVVIHKMQNPTSEEDTVRIFLEFTNIAQAIKAVVDSNQRFFGGRAIRATFYSPDDFAQSRYEA